MSWPSCDGNEKIKDFAVPRCFFKLSEAIWTEKEESFGSVLASSCLQLHKKSQIYNVMTNQCITHSLKDLRLLFFGTQIFGDQQ